ncbi:MAG: sulfatase [Myxococcota bacterium]
MARTRDDGRNGESFGRVALLCVLVLGLLACPGAEPVGPESPPNLVLVSLDTLRADHLGLYGYARDTSPNLDALADRSVVFEMALSHSSHTAPAHRALFQARTVSRTTQTHPVLAEVLAEAGYQTAAFTGAGKVSAKLGFDRGFQHFEEEIRGFGASFPRIESWIEAEASPPFFLFLHTYDVHLPYDPPPPFDTLFSDDYEGPVAGPRTREIVRKVLRYGEYEDYEGELELTPEDRAEMVALYDGGIRYTDRFIARLEAALRARGVWDDTVVAIVSDHGEEFWDHDSLAHGLTLYQEVLHVPLILRLPGAFGADSAGRRVAEPVRLMDLAPTLLELAGVEPPDAFRGRSLVPLLDGEALPAAFFLGEIDQATALVRHPWKLIRRPRLQHSELYLLSEDPGEVDDLAEARPGRTRELEGELRRLMKAPDRGRVEPVNPARVDDDELREQLRALGYVE